MYKVYCDKCGELIPSVNDQVNLDKSVFTALSWNAFGMPGFNPGEHEYQLCAKCAAAVDAFINGKEGAK